MAPGRAKRQPLQRSGSIACLLAACSAATVAGCAAGPREVRPRDFAGAAVQPTPPVPVHALTIDAEPGVPAPAPVAVRLDEPDPAAPGPPAPVAAPAPPGLGGTAGEPRVLDALVGQINGQPVYADDLLADLDAQLAALGGRLEPGVFEQRAAELIDSTLRERLVNALILGEAERALTENQRAGVRYLVAERREDLLRTYGRGSLAVARPAAD